MYISRLTFDNEKINAPKCSQAMHGQTGELTVNFEVRYLLTQSSDSFLIQMSFSSLFSKLF